MINNGNLLTEEEWYVLRKTYGNECIGPGPHKGHLSADHIVPRSAGGPSVIANIQPLCQSCNSRKGTRAIDYRNSVGVGQSVNVEEMLASIPGDSKPFAGSSTFSNRWRYVTVRIWKRTRRKLRLLSALSGESMIGMLNRLLIEELDRQAKKAKEMAND